MTTPTRALLVGIALAGFLVGCTPNPEELNISASQNMQISVTAAANQAATGDTDGALRSLQRLQDQLTKAIESQQVTAKRGAKIQQSLDLVQADLQSTKVAPETVSDIPSPLQTPGPADSPVGGGVPGPADSPVGGVVPGIADSPVGGGVPGIADSPKTSQDKTANNGKQGDKVNGGNGNNGNNGNGKNKEK